VLLPILNLIRLFFYLVFLLPFFLINKEKTLYIFIKFAGPSFIKLAQLLSVRSDLVGEKISATLAKFQDKIPPFSQAKTHKILKEEFGENFEKIFKSFDFNPIASASIAQVHKAQLKDNQLVAVKIIRPNIHKEMRRDIATIKLIAKILKIFSPFLSKTFSDIQYLLIQTARYELDLLHEGANGSKLKDEMIDAKGFYVPTIYWQYSSIRILVIEWIEGISFSNHEAIKSSKFDKKILAENLVLSYFRQVYVNGFFHADMHPGNLFLTPKGDIAVVDFGIMGKIDKKTRIAVAEVLIGFLHRDYKRVAEIHIEAGFVPPDTNIDDLAISCRKIGEMIVGVNVKDISIAKLLTNLIALTKDYNMDTKPELLLLQKTLLLVEGVGVKLDPDLNIWDLARPWVKEWAKTNIGFDAKISDAIMDILKIVKNFIKNK
jgi:ubiquinone biosynthesis protein